MAERPVAHIFAPSDLEESAPGDHAAARPIAELRGERSRFSSWLARFGLGELTDPILRPMKRSVEPGSAS